MLSGRGEWGTMSAGGGMASDTPAEAAPAPAPEPAPPPTPAPAPEPPSSDSSGFAKKSSQRFDWNPDEIPSGDYQAVVSDLEEEEDEGLGWLGEDDFDLNRGDGGGGGESDDDAESSRRMVNINEIHKIAGLSEISGFKRIIEQDGKASGSSGGVRIPKAVRGEAPAGAASGAPSAGAPPAGGPSAGGPPPQGRGPDRVARVPRGPAPSGRSRQPQQQRGSGRHQSQGAPQGGGGRRATTGRQQRPGGPPRSKPQQQRRGERLVTYLICDIYDRPFKLNPEFTYVIGRDENVSICLPDETVSRKHATILFEKGTYIIEDARSLNGTYVNGRCITSTRLRSEDVIRIGPFLFRVLATSEGEAAPTCGVSLTTDTRHLPALPGPLTCRLGPTDVAELLLFVNRTQRTGVVTLRYDRWAGRFFVRDGEVVHCRAGKAVGDEAMGILLKVESGSFHFSEEDVRVKRTVTRSTFEHIELALQDVVES